MAKGRLIRVSEETEAILQRWRKGDEPWATTIERVMKMAQAHLRCIVDQAPAKEVESNG